MNQFQEKKWILILMLFSMFGLSAFNSCGDSLEGPDTEDNENDTLSEEIFMSGRVITTSYSAWPIPENEEPSIDTTQIGFLMKIYLMPGEENSLRVYGLEGADVGKREHYLYPNCENPNDCKIIGTLADEELEIDISNNDRSYQATGNIYQTYDPYVEMRAIYNYQNTTIEYELEGGVSDE